MLLLKGDREKLEEFLVWLTEYLNIPIRIKLWGFAYSGLDEIRKLSDEQLAAIMKKGKEVFAA